MELVIEATGPGTYDSDVIAFEPEYTATDTIWKLPPPQHDVNTSLSLASLDYSKVPKLKPFCVYRADLPHQLSFEWVGTSDPKLFFKNVMKFRDYKKLRHAYRSERMYDCNSSRVATLGKLNARIELKFYSETTLERWRDVRLGLEKYALTLNYGSVISTPSR
ncbi:hypothetical protein ABG067_007186 [Albugo candida]